MITEHMTMAPLAILAAELGVGSGKLRSFDRLYRVEGRNEFAYQPSPEGKLYPVALVRVAVAPFLDDLREAHATALARAEAEQAAAETRRAERAAAHPARPPKRPRSAVATVVAPAKPRHFSPLPPRQARPSRPEVSYYRPGRRRAVP